MADPTPEMFALGEAVFMEGVAKLRECKEQNREFVYKRDELIIKKRMAVVELMNGVELILKAILVKNGYNIYRLKNGIVLQSARLSDVIDPQRTLEVSEVLQFFRRRHAHSGIEEVDKLRVLRNQIVHRGTNIGVKRRMMFHGVMDYLLFLYEAERVKRRTFPQKLLDAKPTI